MAIYAKDALKIGTAFPPDGRGGRRREEFTPERVAHLTGRLNDMLKDGLNIPLCKEHQPRGGPMTQEQYEKFLAEKIDLIVGHTESGYLHPTSKHMEIEVCTPTPDGEAALAKTRFVSPQIERDFVDGHGKLWPGESVVHFAITPRPVQHDQQPFRPLTDRKNRQEGSAVAAMSLETPPGVLRLSMEDFDVPEEDKIPVESPKDAPPETPETPPSNDLPPEKTGADAEGGKDAHFAECMELLKEHGIVLPDDTTEKNFCERLKTCLVGLQGMLKPAGGNDEENAMPPENQTGTPQPVNETAATLMSLQSDNKKLREQLHKGYARDMGKRLDGLKAAGFLSDKRHKEMVAEIDKVQMSLDGKPNSLDARVADLEDARKEAIRRGSFLDNRVALSTAVPTPVERPEEPTKDPEDGDQMSEKRQNEVLDWMFKNAAPVNGAAK